MPLHMKDEADALLADLELKGVLGWSAMRQWRTYSTVILSPSRGARGCGLNADQPVHREASASHSIAGHRLPERGEGLQVLCEVGRPARVLPDPSRAGEPDVDCVSPVGGASFSIYFPDSEKISWRNKRFLRMKKSGGESPKSDEHRKIANSPPSPKTNRVSASFDSHPLRRSEQIRQKNKVNKLDDVYYSVRFAKEVTIFHFDPKDIVKCNFIFPDGWRWQHRGEGGGAHHGRLHTDDGELVRVPHTQDPHAVHGDRHGAAAPGGRGGPRVAVVGLAAARQEDVTAGGFHDQAYEMGCRCQPRRPYFPPAGPFWMPGGDETGGRFEELPSGAAPPPLLPPAAPLGAWAGPAVAPRG